MKTILYFVVCLLFSASPTWSQRSDDPATHQPDKQRSSFAEFALKQINSQNTDYGCEIDEARRLAVHETVKSIDFWTVLIAFSVLILSFFVLVHQQMDRNRREVITANCLAQYHNSWVDASKQAEDAIRRYNQLVHATNKAAEADARSQLPDADQSQAGTAKLDRVVDGKLQSGAAAIATSAKSAANEALRSESGRGSQRPGPASQADLIAQISTLQQQLIGSHEREKHLQKELSRSQLRASSEHAREANAPR